MIILGIESSCDDTSVALVEATEDGFFVIAEKTASQIEVHKKYGGVVPEIAGRMHAENIMPVIEEILRQAQDKPDVIAVTAGPGLITGLLVGVEAAKTLSYLWNVPLIGVNHIEGHIHSVFIPRSGATRDLSEKTTIALHKSIVEQQTDASKDSSPVERGRNGLFPALCLVVSGGHTELILMRDHGEYELIGKTRDDAAGECFDKVGKLIGFDYPGGPQISQFATEGNPKAINFPRPMLNDKEDFSATGGPAFGWSFAGLKTAALYWLRDHQFIPNPEGVRDLSKERSSTPSKSHVDQQMNAPKDSSPAERGRNWIADFCASFEQAIVDVLVGKTLKAAKQFHPKTIILAGGVAANKKLRETLQTTILHSTFYIPHSNYCMDNGAMIAVAGYYKALKKEFTSWNEITVDPNWKVYEKN